MRYYIIAIALLSIAPLTTLAANYMAPKPDTYVAFKLNIEGEPITYYARQK